MPMLQAGYLAVAIKIQERALAMSHSDIQTRISDSLSDQSRGTGKWCYLVAVLGDDMSGDCVYSCDGNLMKATYTCSTSGATVDMKSAVDVVPLTTYQVEPANSRESASGKSMDMSAAKSSLKKAIERHKKHMAGTESTNEASQQKMMDDMESAYAAMGTKATESAALKLTESAATTDAIVLKESRADYEIKLIAPGKGSSAFYPAEVLKRDGPKVFKASTHVYLNHPTATEESQRPEGDVGNLAGVLTTDAVYHESHAKGAGLYARMKVFADHAQLVEEKAAHVGMSIRASGVAESGKMRDGVPILKELTGAESVDVVTRAGAGGMILTEAAKSVIEQAASLQIERQRSIEAARAANPKEGGAAEMDAAEVTKLVEAAVKAALAPVLAQQVPLTERAIRGDAREEATRILSGVTLHEAAKTMIVENVLRDIPQKDGALDVAKFKESVDAEAKRVGAAFAAANGGGRVTGMGSAPVQIDAKEAERRAEAAKNDEAQAISIFESLGMPKEAAAAAAKGRAA